MTDPATVDHDEVARFGAIAEAWWDPRGKFAPLHAMNPCRLGYIVEQIVAETGRDPRSLTPLEGLRILDIGCGGGLVAEPMARLGGDVTGIDPSPETTGVASAHAAQSGLAIDYRATTAEALAAAGARFDVVLALEVIEHVPDSRGFLATCAELVSPGGVVIVSTLNRTARSWAMAILGAEYLLGWLPRGTHDWSRFVSPDDLAAQLADAGLAPVDRRGMVFDPFTRDWRLSATDLSVNHLATAVAPTPLQTPEEPT